MDQSLTIEDRDLNQNLLDPACSPATHAPWHKTWPGKGLASFEEIFKQFLRPMVEMLVLYNII